MNWDAIGAIGEIIGALAVFVTLVYLSLQIRQNTRAVHSSALDSTVNTISNARQSIYENDEAANIYLKGLSNPDSLSDVDRMKFRLLVHNLMHAQSNIFAQTKFSDLPISEWNAQRTIIKRVLGSPGGQWFWEEYGCEFDQDFRDEVEKVGR